MNTQLTKKIDYSYSVNGIYRGKIFAGDTVVGYFDTSPSKNINLAWDDDAWQYLIQSLMPRFAEIPTVDVQQAVYSVMFKR